MLAERTINEDREYELVEKTEFLRDLNTYFPKLMSYLWDQPKIVASIIQNASNKDLKQYIAPLFANNFYENILSTYYIEDNLMYLLTLLLKDEIFQMNNVYQSDNFLKYSPCGYVLEELKRKSDIQAFFKTIIFDNVQNLEVNHSSYRFKFKISNLKEDYVKEQEKNMKKKKMPKKEDDYLMFSEDSRNTLNSISFDDSEINGYRYKKQMQSIIENFNRNYIPNLDKKALKDLMEENKDNKNKYEYCYTKLNECSVKDIYTNEIFLQNLYKCDLSNEILIQYQTYFTEVINFIDSILDNIINNFHILPYSVKCICKIISLLITKKFPSISEIEKNVFISKFFFMKLLIPILRNPGLEGFISDFIISENTLRNLFTITQIIRKFTSGKFFVSNDDTGDYTPYNWFFLEKLDKYINICNHLTKVKLPSFIEKFINDELPENYEYNYFKENPEEVINYRSILFNLEQIKALLDVMNKCPDKIFKDSKNNGLKKTVEKLMTINNQQILNNILSTEKKKVVHELSPPKTTKKDKDKDKVKAKEEKEIENPKVHYFLITTLLTNDRYKELFAIDQKTPNFSIKELKSTPDEEAMMKNNIIKVKNFFCSLLYNYNKLVKTDFDEGTTVNTEKILKELNIFMKSSNFVVDGSIPSEWYVNSLLEYLQKIPKDLTDNDCEKLYNEIESDVNKSIKSLDFEALSVIIGKLKYSRRGKFYYEESKNLLNDIKINEDAKSLIEGEFIPVEIKFNLDNGIGDFQINISNFKEKERNSEEKKKDHEKSKKARLCTTIDEFTKKFPNLVKYQELQDLDIFEIQKNLNFPAKINYYLNIVNMTLKKKGISELKLMNQKIYDYVMCKIYDKIYPVEPYEKDNKIFQNSVRLSWAEPQHFIKSKRKFVFGSFITDVLKYFKIMDEEKSPRKKILNMNEIFNSIGFLLKFNGVGADAGVDDQMPILNYAFVKAQPLRIFSNAKYMELYIGEKKNKNEGSQLTQLSSICDFISVIKYSDLIDVSAEEYIKKCNEATILDSSISA